MCGIAGAVGKLSAEEAERLERATATMVHRGPDGHGFWRSSPDLGDGAAVFGHRRLAIIELSEAGAQPMTDPQGNTICFNGEIYNYRELRQELEALGENIRSDTDTEVLMAALRRWGSEALPRLRGMFAFAYWRAQDRRVLLARDRLGIKPLHLASVGTASSPLLLFASELRALLATDLLPRRLNREALGGYLWLGHRAGAESIVDGVTALDPGSFLWVDAHGQPGTAQRYWKLTGSDPSPASEEEARHALEEATRLRLISDRPLGTFLSGGIDSSALANIASRQSSAKIKTFNLCFDEARFDESGWARQVADALGCEHTEIRLSQARFREQLPRALNSLDHPTFDGLNTWFVSRAVRDAGITVALSGAGGDELFGGYRSFVDMPKAQRLARALRLVPAPLLRAAAGLVSRFKHGPSRAVPPLTRWGKLEDLFLARSDLVRIYQCCYALFTQRYLERISAPGLHAGMHFGLGEALHRSLRESITGRETLDAIGALELRSFIGQRLLYDTDTTSMDVSLEVRVPLLDHVFLETVQRLPPAQRFEPVGRKDCLRRIGLRGLDPQLFERPKAGFVLPTEEWSKDELAPAIRETFADSQLCADAGLQSPGLIELFEAYHAGHPGLYWSRIWSLYTLLHWVRQHGMSLS